jgi:hypothetical protein
MKCYRGLQTIGIAPKKPGVLCEVGYCDSRIAETIQLNAESFFRSPFFTPRFISWSSLPLAGSIQAEPRVVLALWRARRFVSHRKRPRFTSILSCPPKELHAQCHAQDRPVGRQAQLYSAACDAPVKGQCQLNDSEAAYRHAALLFQRVAICLRARSKR